jgi:hypothetical protein
MSPLLQGQMNWSPVVLGNLRLSLSGVKMGLVVVAFNAFPFLPFHLQLEAFLAINAVKTAANKYIPLQH